VFSFDIIAVPAPPAPPVAGPAPPDPPFDVTVPLFVNVPP
jgi:hypothetical protein